MGSCITVTERADTCAFLFLEMHIHAAIEGYLSIAAKILFLNAVRFARFQMSSFNCRIAVSFFCKWEEVDFRYDECKLKINDLPGVLLNHQTWTGL